MKKLFLLLLTILVNSFVLFSSPADSVHEYTLENGLKVFILEDHTSPFITFEFAVRAGFSSQTQETSGFFKLYTNLFKASLTNIKFTDASCYSDSSRYILTTTNSKIQEQITSICNTAFSPQFSDQLITNELSKLKTEVKENYESLSGLINSAIDSRVFSSSPWKHDSGVYPSIFGKTTTKQARTILNTISNRYYIPQNSAIFITGNFNEKQMLELIELTFGSYYSSYSAPKSKPSPALNKQKKFVIHDPEFSSEMTQVVIQYTSFKNMELCDLTATILNNNYSFFKYNLLNIPELNIPGDEYIDASSAHKKDSSRLIIQTLIQPPENSSIKTNSLAQAVKFSDQVKFGISQISQGEFLAYQEQLINDMNSISSNSAIFMDKLSSYWAIDPYSEFLEDSLSSNVTTQSLLSRIEKIKKAELKQIDQITLEEPFIFILINSKDFNANKKAYLNAGFEEITRKNASWYNQENFANVKTSEESETDTSLAKISTDNDYYKNNIDQIKKFRLLNGIPVTTKYNPNSSQISILLSIRGGKLNSAQNHGFEEVMVNLLATNIQKEIYISQQDRKIQNPPSLFFETNVATSYICVECTKSDFEEICTAISRALIYSEIIPTAADRAVSNRQYKKRLENGSATNQMYCAMIKQVYPKTDFVKIFESEKDILENTSYQSILEAYPSLLDAGRYNLIITGNFDSNLEKTLNKTIALLANQNSDVHFSSSSNLLPKNKTVNIKINHTFLTDIPKEKAGPMPAILIPTTEFLDPILFAFDSPDKNSKEYALFNAMLYYIESKMNEAISVNPRLKNAKAYVSKTLSQMNTACLTIQNVPHMREVDSTYRDVIVSIENELKSSQSQKTLQKIIDNWIQVQLSDTSTNSGTAILMQEGIENFPFEPRPEFYLDEYNYIQNATVLDYTEILNYFPQKPSLKIYSRDGKK